MTKAYNPKVYYSDVEKGKFCNACNDRHTSEPIEQVVIGSERGTTFPAKLQSTKCNALIDTGATRSCISASYFRQLPIKNLKYLHQVTVRSTTSSSLAPLGVVNYKVQFGGISFENDFIVCKHLMRTLILGKDFIYKHSLKVSYDNKGDCVLEHKNKNLVTVESIDELPSLSTQRAVTIPRGSLMILNVRSNVHSENVGQIYDVRTNEHLCIDEPNLYIVPTLHRVDYKAMVAIPYTVINLGEDDIHLEANTVIGYLKPEQIDISEITTKVVEANQFIDEGYVSEDEFQDAKPPFNFLTSPVDIDPHRKTNLKDFELSQEDSQKFRNLCDKFEDIFSESSEDIGKTPLIQMDIDTGDSPPVCQHPYTLPLKHVEWVKREIAILEKAGVIVQSVSPWASPVVVVPK